MILVQASENSRLGVAGIMSLKSTSVMKNGIVSSWSQYDQLACSEEKEAGATETGSCCKLVSNGDGGVDAEREQFYQNWTFFLFKEFSHVEFCALEKRCTSRVLPTL